MKPRRASASANTLTAAATLAVGLAPRQQHLQTVPEHDCSGRTGLQENLGKETELHLNDWEEEHF